jgi:hypothetical protein
MEILRISEQATRFHLLKGTRVLTAKAPLVLPGLPEPSPRKLTTVNALAVYVYHDDGIDDIQLFVGALAFRVLSVNVARFENALLENDLAMQKDANLSTPLSLGTYSFHVLERKELNVTPPPLIEQQKAFNLYIQEIWRKSLPGCTFSVSVDRVVKVEMTPLYAEAKGQYDYYKTLLGPTAASKLAMHVDGIREPLY